MNRLGLVATFVALLSFGAHAQSPVLPGPGLPVASGGGGLSIDGTPVGANTGGGTSLSLPGLTTIKTNDRVVVMVLTNDTGGVTGVSGSTLGAFTQRGTTNCTSGDCISEWYKVASGTLSSEVITTTTASAQFMTAAAIAINGSTGFDPASATLYSGNPAVGTAPVAVTTTHGNTIVFAGYKMNSTASPTAGSGWTAAYGSNFMLFEYQIVSSASTYTATITTGSGDENSGIGDAVF